MCFFFHTIQEYIFPLEIPDTLYSLSRMAESSEILDLDKSNLHQEAYKFKELIQLFIDNSVNLVNKAKVIYFDGR